MTPHASSSSPRRRRIAGERQPGRAAGQQQTETPDAAPRSRRSFVRPTIPEPSAEPREKSEGTPIVVRRPIRAKKAETETAPAPRAAASPKSGARGSELAASRRRFHWLDRRFISFIALVLGVVAAIAGYLYMRADQPLGREDAQAAADTAATSAEQVLSFDYRDLDALSANVDGLLTDSYMTEEFEPTLTELREQAPTAQAQVQTRVHAAATEPCRDGDGCPPDEAVVLLVVDRITLTANLDSPTVTPQRLRVTMRQGDTDQWLIDAIEYVGA